MIRLLQADVTLIRKSENQQGMLVYRTIKGSKGSGTPGVEFCKMNFT